MFNLDKDQLKKLNEWKNQFPKNRPEGAIGGAFTYSFTPTSLGVIVVVKDEISGKEIDLTDYKDW